MKKMILEGRGAVVLVMIELASSARRHLIGIVAIVMQLITIATYIILWLLWRIPG